MPQITFTAEMTKGEALTVINANFTEVYGSLTSQAADINSIADNLANKQDILNPAPTVLGGNFIGLTNPSAETFIRINEDATVDTLIAADFLAAIGGSAIVSALFALP